MRQNDYGLLCTFNSFIYLDDVSPVPELDPVLCGAELPVVVVVELDELAFNT